MTTQRLGRSLALAAAIAAIGGLASHSDPARAGIPVVDGGHIGIQAAEFAKEVTRHAAQVAHWQQQIEDWKNKLSQNPLARVTEQGPNARQKIGDKLQIRGDDYGADQACGASSGGNPLAGITNVFQVSFNPNGNLIEEQKKLCLLQVALENRKWNENALMIKQMELLEDQLKTVADARKQGMTQGEIDTSFGDIAVAESDFNANRTKGQARVQTYDGMLASVTQMQSRAAQQMMSGTKPNGFFGAAANTLVQGAILEAALTVGSGSCGSKLGDKC